MRNHASTGLSSEVSQRSCPCTPCLERRGGCSQNFHAKRRPSGLPFSRSQWTYDSHACTRRKLPLNGPAMPHLVLAMCKCLRAQHREPIRGSRTVRVARVEAALRRADSATGLTPRAIHWQVPARSARRCGAHTIPPWSGSCLCFWGGSIGVGKL
jgi:hypothetical protein